MSRQVKNAKDIVTGELVYFVSHAKATYLGDGSTVEDTVNGIKRDIKNITQSSENTDTIQGKSLYLNNSKPYNFDEILEILQDICDNQNLHHLYIWDTHQDPNLYLGEAEVVRYYDGEYRIINNVMYSNSYSVYNYIFKTDGTYKRYAHSIKPALKEDVVDKLDKMINVTYSELVALRDNSQLIPGQQYRIIDYETTTVQADTRSAGHQFDIIVTADDEKTLNEVARACRSEFNIEKYKDGYLVDMGTSDIISKMQYVGIFTYGQQDFYLYESEQHDTQMLMSFKGSSKVLESEGEYMFAITATYVRWKSNSWSDWLHETYVGVAFKHDPNEDTSYFNNSDLAAWQIWYSLDNDAEKFAWAIDFGFLRNEQVFTWNGNDNDSSGSLMYEWEASDGTIVYTKTLTPQVGESTYDDLGDEDGIVDNIINGKGVIYRMIDEYSNECPYDFKNIKFYNDERGTDVYTFTWIDDSHNVMDTTVFGNNGTLTYYSEIPGVYSNVIKPYVETIYDEDSGEFLGTKQSLNNITFISDYEWEGEGNEGFYGCRNNSFSNNCYNNSFGNNCYNNSFGDGCYNNSFSNDCYNNSFGNDCNHNSFSDNCYSNSFGNNCHSNIFGLSYYFNSLGDICNNNSFGNYCNHNSFGNDCYHNSFGDSCEKNSFGNYFYYNSFGNNCNSNSFSNNCNHNSFGNGCYSNSFGNGCEDNSFGNDCIGNIFGSRCTENSFHNSVIKNSLGTDCVANVFYNDCYYNSFGNSCHGNTLLSTCKGNSFGNNCNSNKLNYSCHNNSFENGCDANDLGFYTFANSFGNNCCNIRLDMNYCNNNHFDDGCSYIRLYSFATTGSNNPLQNINVSRGICGTRSNTRYIIVNTLNSEKEINVFNYNGHIYVDYGDAFKVTYSELVDLRDNSQLIAGRQYRITDYVTSTSQENTKSADHQFDIIVTALDNYTLSEEAQAAQNENDGYFDDSNLSAWKIWYSLDNDTSRFAWAGDERIERKNVIEIIADSEPCTIKSDLIDGNTFITPFNFESCVWVDTGGSYEVDNHDINELVYEWDYFLNEKYGNVELCIYKSNADLYEEEGCADSGDKYVYRGLVTVDGETYDYWQKYEMNENGEYDELVIGGTGYVYATTPRIVSNPEDYSYETTTTIVETVTPLDPKGVIYRMIDEWGNDCPYDFKNIQFKRWAVTKYDKVPSLVVDSEDNYHGYYYGAYDFDKQQTIPDATYGNKSDWFYTFALKDLATDTWHDYTIVNRIGLHTDDTVIITCHSNIINECRNQFFEYGLKATMLNNIVFFNCYSDLSSPKEHNRYYSFCENNSFGNGCENNSFGKDCENNSFGNGCSSNSFGNGCKYNSFGNDFYTNSFGNDCMYNSFGNGCSSNSFGNGCKYNSFGNGCSSNSLGYGCSSNSFGNGCSSNSFGNGCESNSFGNDCYNNSFRVSPSNKSALKDYCCNNHLDDGCWSNVIWNSYTTSFQNQLKNINVNRGVGGTVLTYNYINVETINAKYEIKVAKNSKGETKIYCEADLIK